MADAESLFVSYRTPVLRYLSRIVGNWDSAQELTQEVFLRITRSAVPAAEPPQIRAWVFRIARNVALNHVRDRSRAPELVTGDRAKDPAMETGVAVQQALDQLSPEDRDVFLLREMAGLSYDEIAAAPDLTPTRCDRASIGRASRFVSFSIPAFVPNGGRASALFHGDD